MNWQKLKDRLTGAAWVLGGLVVLAWFCMLFFSLSMVATTLLDAIAADKVHSNCQK